MNVRLKHTMSFTAGIYYGEEICMNHYTVTMHMLTNKGSAESYNTAFERIKYLVYNELDSAIFISISQQDKCKQLSMAGLKVITMPGDPVDQLIGLMLHYKLNAIVEDYILIEETEISSILGENIIYLHSNDEQVNLESIPSCWTSTDLLISEYVSPKTDKILTMHSTNSWHDLGLSWPDNKNTETTESGNIVVFADFKPNHDTK
jgi:hypothetical protein